MKKAFIWHDRRLRDKPMHLELKEQFTQKERNLCHYLLTLISFENFSTHLGLKRSSSKMTKHALLKRSRFSLICKRIIRIGFVNWINWSIVKELTQNNDLFMNWTSATSECAVISEFSVNTLFASVVIVNQTKTIKTFSVIEIRLKLNRI